MLKNGGCNFLEKIISKRIEPNLISLLKPAAVGRVQHLATTQGQRDGSELA